MTFTTDELQMLTAAMLDYAIENGPGRCDIEALLDRLRHEQRIAKVREFKDYLWQRLMDSDASCKDDWFNTKAKFTIAFGNQCVQLDNDADVFGGIVHVLEEYIGDHY